MRQSGGDPFRVELRWPRGPMATLRVELGGLGLTPAPSDLTARAAARTEAVRELVRQLRKQRRRGGVPKSWRTHPPAPTAGPVDAAAAAAAVRGNEVEYDQDDWNDPTHDGHPADSSLLDPEADLARRLHSGRHDQDRTQLPDGDDLALNPLEGSGAPDPSVQDDPVDNGPVDDGPVDDDAVVGELAVWLRAEWLVQRPAWVTPQWYDAPLRPDVRALLGMPLGPELITRLHRLDTGPCPADHSHDAEPDLPLPGSTPGFPCCCQVVIAAAWDAVGSWTAARAAATLVAFTGGEPVETPVPDRVFVDRQGRRWRPLLVDQSREEFAPALRISPDATGTRITTARELLHHPRLAAHVESGGCSAWAAKTVLAQVESLHPTAAAVVVNRVVDRLEQRHRSGKRPWTSGEIRDAARRQRLRLPTGIQDQARQQATRDRRVVHRPCGDGMADLIATIPETDAHRIYRRLTAVALGLDDPTRSRDQIRADLLTDLLLAAGIPQSPPAAPDDSSSRTPAVPVDPSGSGEPAGPHPAGNSTTAVGGAHLDGASGANPGVIDPGRSLDPAGDPFAALPAAQSGQVHVNVVVSLPTLLGLRADPAEIPGLGPIPADIARELAADHPWRAWITDAAGTIVATSSSRYTPPEPLARLIRARERHCRMPGCRRPSDRSELDHVIPAPRGRTSDQNLGPLCKRHHQMKTHGGWLQWPDHPDTTHPPDARPPEHDVTDGPDDDSPPGWTWRTPAGFLIHDEAEPPLPDPTSNEPDPPNEHRTH